MYLILKPKCNEIPFADGFKNYSSIKFPASCRTTRINILNDSVNVASNCCRGLSIFNDNDISNNVPVKSEVHENIENSTTNGCNDGTEEESRSSAHDSFYECNVVVKGFRDHLIKGQSIWTQHETK